MIYLSDIISTGHHGVYKKSLLALDDCVDKSEELSFCSNKKRLLSYYLDRLNYYTKLVSENVPAGTIHFLYFDFFSFLPVIHKKPRRHKIVCTLHRLPNSRMRYAFLKYNSRHIDALVVHSQYIKDELVRHGISNVVVIEYPNFSSFVAKKSVDSYREAWGVEPNKTVLALLGGTRHDKGLDIFLDSLKLLNKKQIDSLHLLILGKEEFFKRDYIESLLSSVGVGYTLQLEFVPDEVFSEAVFMCDYVVLPYRSSFTGNSGPMTEAMDMKKKVIVSNIPSLKTFAKEGEYIGEFFETGSANALSRVLENVLIEGKTRTYRSDQTFKADVFLKKHQKLYDSLTN